MTDKRQVYFEVGALCGHPDPDAFADLMVAPPCAHHGPWFRSSREDILVLLATVDGDQGSNMTDGPGVKYDPSTNQTQELLTRPTSSTSSGGAHAMAHADARAREVQGQHLIHMNQRKLTQALTSVWIAVCKEHGGEPPVEQQLTAARAMEVPHA